MIIEHKTRNEPHHQLTLTRLDAEFAELISALAEEDPMRGEVKVRRKSVEKERHEQRVSLLSGKNVICQSLLVEVSQQIHAGGEG